MKSFYKFLILTCFILLSAWSNYAWGSTSLTVNISGGGSIKVSTSSTQPSGSWSSSTVNKDANTGYLKTTTYYIWANPNAGYRCTGVTRSDVVSSISAENGYYTVKITSLVPFGNTPGTVTVNFVADFYGKADSYADPSAGGKTYVSINGNWPNPSTDASQYKAHDESTKTTTAVTSAPKYTANFAAYLYDGYKFDGWYTEENKGGTKKSGNTTYSEDFTANSTTSSSPTTITRYAHFTPVTVNSVVSYTSTLNFTQPGNASTTIKFNVSNADATDDFTYSLTGEVRDETNGGWVVDSWSYSNNQISIKLKYYCTKYTAQSSDLVNHKATITLTSKAANGTSQSADVFANVNLTPSLSVSPTSKDFGEFTLAKDPVQTQTFTFTFNNLNSPADNVVLVTAPTAPFSASWTASSTNTKTLTVSFNPTAVDNWSQQIVVEARNSQTPYIAVPCTLTVSGSAKRNNVTYTCNIADNYMVDATAINLASLWTSNNNEQAPAYDIVSFTPSGSNNEGATAPAIDENNILSLGQAGTLVLSISQPQTTSFNKKDDTKTITIHKYTSTFANASSLTGKVGATNIQSNYTLTYVKPSGYVDNTTPTAGTPGLGSTSGNYYYTISQTVNRDNQVGCPAAHKDEVVVYNAGSKTATAWNKGVATISLKQKETYKFTEANTSFTITVDKNSNEVLNNYKWKDNNSATLWTRSLGFEDGAYVQFRSNNMETGAPSIIVRQIEGEDVATFFPDSVTNDVNGDAFYTSFTVGTAKWKVSQPENYKYYAAAERQFNLTVGESDCNCVLKQETWSSSFQKPVADIGTWDFGGIGETLSFELRSNYAAGNHMTYTLITDGHNESPVKLKAESELYFASVGNITLGEGEHNTTGVIFAKSSASGINTDNPYVHNIVVTRKRWMKLKATSDATATISSLTKLQRKVGTAEKTATFYVDFSTCSPRVKVGSNYGNVTFGNGLTKDTISTNNTGKTGYNAVLPVTIHYSSDTIESKTVTITVYTEDKNATLTIPVQTTGLESEIVYIGNASYPVDNVNVPASELFAVRDKSTKEVIPGAVVTIAGNNDATAQIVSNEMDPICSGNITLTASFAGNSYYEAAENVTQPVAITKIDDEVTITNTQTVLNIEDEINLSGLVTAISNTAITFSSSDPSIFRVEGNTLIAVAAGKANLIATSSDADCAYNSAYATQEIRVNPSEYVFTGEGSWDVGTWLYDAKPAVNADADIKVTGNLTIDQSVEVKSLTIEGEGAVTMVENGVLTINGDSKDEEMYGNLYVKNGGEVVVNGSLRVRDLTVEASIGTSNGTARSGQIDQAEHITYANAYIEIHMDPTGVMDDSKWYGFTVPFPVDVHNGVSRKEGKVYRDCVYGSHYFIAEYDADKRLTTGKGWKYITTATLNPGQFYYFTVNGTYNTYRFKAAENTYSAVTEKALDTNGEGADANWNGVGNSTLQHAKAAYTGGSYVQVYQNGLDAYKTVPTASTTFVVGCPFFIQASETSTLTLSQPLTKGTSAFYAPRHEQEEQNDAICVNFSAVDGNYSDPIYVSATDKEQDVYVLGHDLSKAGESKMVPQMWVDAYGKKLSVHESNWQGNNAYCTLGLYVPANGEYVISAAQPEDNTRIYLTQNGQPIWDLTQTEYTLSLQKGNTASYGLMIVKAPQITTGVDQTQTDDVQESKVIINNTLFILRNGQMYDASGRKVK